MLLKIIPGGAFVENTYILQADKSDEIILVDPGSQIEDIERSLKDIDFKTIHIWNTHGHLDHACGVEHFKSKYNAKFFIHRKELPILDAMPSAAARFGIEEFAGVIIPEVDGFIEDQKSYSVGNLNFETILVPGHSPGSICFYFKEEANKKEKMKQDIIISGDTVFAGSVGRVDLTGGTNMQDLVGNITRRLLCLKDETILFPGHGPHTTIEVEKQSNPYLMGNL